MKFTTILLIATFSVTFTSDVAKGYDNTSITFTKTADHKLYRSVAKQMQLFETYTKNIVNSAMKKILPYFMEYSEKVKLNVSQECMKNSLAVIVGMKNIKPWAFKFLDASGKVPDGLMLGSPSAMGHYDQCMDLEVKSTKKKDFGKKLFQGRYCVIEVRALVYIPKPKTIHMLDFPPAIKNVIESDSIFARSARFIYYAHLDGIKIGLCIPSGCTKEDLNSVLHTALENPHFSVTALTCEIKEKNSYSTSLILVLISYAAIMLLVLVGSGVEYYASQNNIVFKGKAIRSLLAFSLFTNFRRFCAPSQSTDNIQCLNGMKFIGLTWVLIGHSVASGMGPFTHGILRYESYTKGLPFQAILNAMICVDTFFVIGAFLITFLTTKHVILGKQKFNVLLYVVHRLWRLYPVYIVVLTTCLIVPLIYSGPFYKDYTEVILKPCYKNWWANLLFINNFFDPKEMCYLHTWYLTIDFQLYIFSLIIVLPLIRWPKIALSLLFLGIAGNILYPLIKTYINEWPPIILFSLMDFEETIDLWKYIYVVPWTHFGPYGIGLLTGYIYALNPNVKMSRLTQVFGWCISFTCCFSVLYGSRDWYNRPMPRYLAAVYAGFSRTAWSVGPAWIIYTCSTGHGGIINWILSWRLFTHLGRLTFCAYLIHLIPVVILYSGVRTRVQADIYLSVWFFFGLLCASLAFALILHLSVELPFANLERVFFTSATQKTKVAQNENGTVEGGIRSEKNGAVITLIPDDKAFH